MARGSHPPETLEEALPQRVQDKAEDVLEKAHKAELRVATAESCTGGLLAAVLTDVSGRGHVFERGFVTYSEEAKCDLLGVDRGLIETHGAVSRQVAEAMAAGALSRSDADVAVSVTGFAGPGAEQDEEGLVHFGCARRGGDTCHREEHFGPIGRAGVRIAALEVALEMVDEALGK